VRVPRCDLHHQSLGRLLTGGNTAVLGGWGGLWRVDGRDDLVREGDKPRTIRRRQSARRTNAFTWSMKAVN